MTDPKEIAEYEALWREACAAWTSTPGLAAARRAAAAVIREFVEAKLAEVLEENRRLFDGLGLVIAAKHQEAAEAKLWFTKAQEWKADLGERDATIAEQAALIEKLRLGLSVIQLTVEDEGYKVTADQQPCRHTAALNEINDLVCAALKEGSPHVQD